MPNITKKELYNRLQDARDSGYNSGCAAKKSLEATIATMQARREIIREDALHAMAQMVTSIAQAIKDLGEKKNDYHL